MKLIYLGSLDQRRERERKNKKTTQSAVCPFQVMKELQRRKCQKLVAAQHPETWLEGERLRLLPTCEVKCFKRQTDGLADAKSDWSWGKEGL